MYFITGKCIYFDDCSIRNDDDWWISRTIMCIDHGNNRIFFDMNENKKHILITAAGAIIVFALITDAFLPYTMFAVKMLLFFFVFICALAFLGCISQEINKRYKYYSENETVTGLLFRSGFKTAIVNWL